MVVERVEVQAPGFRIDGAKLAGRKADADVAGQAAVQQGSGVAGLCLEGSGELAHERTQVVATAEGFQPTQAGTGGLEGVEVGRAVESCPSAITDVRNPRFLAAAVDIFGVVVEGRGQVGGDHYNLYPGVRAVDGDFDQVDGFRRIDLTAGGDDQVDGVQLQRAGLGNEVGVRAAWERNAGEHVARELKHYLADPGGTILRVYCQSRKGRTGMSKT